VRESILDGVTGLLATDQDDLVGKVRSLLSDTDLRTDLGDKARIRAEQFSWDVTADVLADQLGTRPGIQPGIQPGSSQGSSQGASPPMG
jgi:glycosyltransferase involved in cell wall biosynthesis